MNFSITHSMLCYQALNWMNVINFNKRFVTAIRIFFWLVVGWVVNVAFAMLFIVEIFDNMIKKSSYTSSLLIDVGLK